MEGRYFYPGRWDSLSTLSNLNLASRTIPWDLFPVRLPKQKQKKGLEFTWRTLKRLEKYSGKLISQPFQFTKSGMYCVAVFYIKNESQWQLALSPARDNFPYAKFPPTLSPVTSASHGATLYEADGERQVRGTVSISQKIWMRCPRSPFFSLLRVSSDFGLQDQTVSQASLTWVCVFIIVTLHCKTVINAGC